MKAAISAVLAGVGLMGLVALAPVSASAMPVATSGVPAEAQGLADGLTQVRWHVHHNWHHRHVVRPYGWHRHHGHHWGWRHRHHW